MNNTPATGKASAASSRTAVAPQAGRGSGGESGSSTRGGDSSGGEEGNETWDPKVAGELLSGDGVSGEPAASGSGHSTGAGAEEGRKSVGGGLSSQRQQQQQQEGGIISRVKGMQDRAGRTQV